MRGYKLSFTSTLDVYDIEIMLIILTFFSDSLSNFNFFSVSKFIRIGIADKNDNPPYFDKQLYEAEVIFTVFSHYQVLGY